MSHTPLFLASGARDPDAVTVASTGSAHARPSSPAHNADPDGVTAFSSLPEESIEGQNGLIKHIMLNDRRRVLTLDTAGEVVMWDLVRCAPVQCFGKRHLEEIAAQVNTTESVSNWCGVDTRTGRLACVLEEKHCFDAETYADELEPAPALDFRDDQRINLGKWVLRYLFANLVDEELRRDDAYRRGASQVVREEQARLQRANAPASIQLPSSATSAWHDAADTPRASDTTHQPPFTPGLAIGIATPAVPVPSPASAHLAGAGLASPAEEASEPDRRMSHVSQPRSSTDRSQDYFSAIPSVLGPTSHTAVTDGHEDRSAAAQSALADADRDNHTGSLFGKKFRMSFGGKKAGRTSSVAEAGKPNPDRTDDLEHADLGGDEERQIEDNLFGVVQEIRHVYQRQLREQASHGGGGEALALAPGITPSMPLETPVLQPPAATTVIIQEDRPDSGGVADLYRGTVASLGREADIVEKAAPMWLGRLLLWVRALS